MKKLPIFDEKWLRKNIECIAAPVDLYYKLGSMYPYFQYYINFKNISLVDTYSIINLNKIDDDHVLREKGYLVFIDEKTNEFYYLDPFALPDRFYPKPRSRNYNQDTTRKRSAQSILNALLFAIVDILNPCMNIKIITNGQRNIDIHFELFESAPYIFTLNTFYIPKTSITSYADIVLNNNFKIKNKKSVKKDIIDWKIPEYNNIIIKYLEEIISGYRDESDLYIFNEYYSKILLDFLENNASGKEVIRQVLHDKALPFAGTWDVRCYTAVGADKDHQNDIDAIDIEITMTSGYSENLTFIRENAKTVKDILRLILTLDNRSEEYANYMQLTSAKLTRVSTLLAQFKFKDGLENIFKEIKKEENDEGI